MRYMRWVFAGIAIIAIAVSLLWLQQRHDAPGEPAPLAPFDDVLMSPEIDIRYEYNVRATRLFAGAGQYPPTDFAAYGIVAFPSEPTKGHDRPRFLDVCKAYSAVLPHTRALPDVPQTEQMVTVWPVKSDALATELNDKPRDDEICERAVDNYDVVTAKRALNQAEAAGVKPYVRGNGPYLLAWSPGATKGEPDALVLLADLSYIKEYDRLHEVFRKWSEDIEQNPDLWRQGWKVERVRQMLRVWADRFGEQILTFVKGS